MSNKFSRFNKTARFLLFSALIIGPALQADITTGQRAGAVAYTGDPKTIAHEFLDREKDFGAGSMHYAAVDDLINKASVRIRARKSYTTEEAVRTLQEVDSLLKEEGFVFKNNLLLSRGLERKVIDCDNYCAIYIAIAEVIKIPVIPVYAPNHTFLRFCFDDGTYLNWETTQGKPRTDSYYLSTLRIPEASVQKGVYMKNLTRKEFMAVEYNNIGSHLMSERKFGEALANFTTAIGLHPLFSSAYHNRGTSYYALNRPDEALADLLTADGLDPSRASTHNTLGDIYFDKKEYDKAVFEFTASIRLDPTNYVPYNSIGLIMNIQGKRDKAGIWFRKSREVRMKYGGR
jgi:tetratricopeptide (TPR) repeat protein